MPSRKRIRRLAANGAANDSLGRNMLDAPNRILVLYGSYRSDRMGIRLAQFVVARLHRRGHDVELIDAKAINLPMLDRMYKEYPKNHAPEALEQLARKIRDADGFVFVTGEYNWGVQPGLKNLTDHFLEEWFWRPAAIASYSAGRVSGNYGILSEMGMMVVSSTIAVGPIGQTLSAEGEPLRSGNLAKNLARSSHGRPSLGLGRFTPKISHHRNDISS
jgi:NAD(P)H-dependent FMN reductase